MQLIRDHSVDQRAIHVVDADDLISVDGKTRFSNGRTDRTLGLGGNVERHQHDDRNGKHKSREHQPRDLVCPRLVNG